MKTIQLNLYPFAELSAEGKEKALSDLWDANVFDDWWMPTYEDSEHVGLKIKGFDIDREHYCKIGFKEDAIHCSTRIMENHGKETATYQVAQTFWKERNSIIFSWPKGKWGDFENEEGLDEALDKVEAAFLRSMGREYLRILIQSYRYLTSEPAIIDTIEANGYFFTAEGELATTLERLAV